jgi:hypothetical protein
VVLGGQAVQDGAGRVVQHGALPGAQPGLRHTELPADGFNSLLGGTDSAAFQPTDGGFGKPNHITKLLHGETFSLAQLPDAVIDGGHDDHLLFVVWLYYNTEVAKCNKKVKMLLDNVAWRDYNKAKELHDAISYEAICNKGGHGDV